MEVNSWCWGCMGGGGILRLYELFQKSVKRGHLDPCDPSDFCLLNREGGRETEKKKYLAFSICSSA